MKVLQGINSSCIDLIYLDPPFNKNDTFVGSGKRIKEIKNYFLHLQKIGEFLDEDFDQIFQEENPASFKDIWKKSHVNAEAYTEIADRKPELIPYLEAVRQSTPSGGYYYLIFMVIRLLEMHRTLKDTGSIYLHCDPTMSHYLKGLLDIIFGKENFKNEIVWKRHGVGGSSKSIGKVHDIIFYYVKTPQAKYNPVSIPLTEKQKAVFRMSDTKGIFKTDHLEAQPAMQGGGSHYTYKGYTPELGWLISQEKLKKMDEEGYVHWTKLGKPRRKYYLHEKEGIHINDLWTDFMGIPPMSKERLGYPTQKPLKLLERIIKSSSQEGDWVLDPFCGCATTCLAAESLNRQWIGIDRGKQTYYMLYYRLRNTYPPRQEEKTPPTIHLERKPPIRTDLREDEIKELVQRKQAKENISKIRKKLKHKLSPKDKENAKSSLYEAQAGKCRDCDTYLHPKELTLDHIHPQAKEGIDDLENLQLLCYRCHNLKRLS
ncbi:MAG: DNA methyltransferase [Cytophagales bacterium]|nr:DNA methyltransferase [Cytophagales bacterium]